MYVQAAMAVASLFSADSKRSAQMEAALADSKLKGKKLQQARARQAGNFANSTQRAREEKQSRDIKIEQNRINAESKIDESFAGSGLSGSTINELDSQIAADVGVNKAQNNKALDRTLADANRIDQQSVEAIDAESLNAGPEAVGGGGVGAAVGAINQGFQAGNALSSNAKAFSKSKIGSALGLG